MSELLFPKPRSISLGDNIQKRVTEFPLVGPFESFAVPITLNNTFFWNKLMLAENQEVN